MSLPKLLDLCLVAAFCSCEILFVYLSLSMCLLGFFRLGDFGPFRFMTPCFKLTLFTAIAGMKNKHISDGLWEGGTEKKGGGGGRTFGCLRGNSMLSSFWTKHILSNLLHQYPTCRSPVW